MWKSLRPLRWEIPPHKHRRDACPVAPQRAHLGRREFLQHRGRVRRERPRQLLPTPKGAARLVHCAKEHHQREKQRLFHEKGLLHLDLFAQSTAGRHLSGPLLARHACENLAAHLLKLGAEHTGELSRSTRDIRMVHAAVSGVNFLGQIWGKLIAKPSLSRPTQHSSANGSAGACRGCTSLCPACRGGLQGHVRMRPGRARPPGWSARAARRPAPARPGLRPGVGGAAATG